jgi:hypothetical protein
LNGGAFALDPGAAALGSLSLLPAPANNLANCNSLPGGS